MAVSECHLPEGMHCQKRTGGGLCWLNEKQPLLKMVGHAEGQLVTLPDLRSMSNSGFLSRSTKTHKQGVVLAGQEHAPTGQNGVAYPTSAGFLVSFQVDAQDVVPDELFQGCLLPGNCIVQK